MDTAVDIRASPPLPAPSTARTLPPCASRSRGRTRSRASGSSGSAYNSASASGSRQGSQLHSRAGSVPSLHGPDIGASSASAADMNGGPPMLLSNRMPKDEDEDWVSVGMKHLRGDEPEGQGNEAGGPGPRKRRRGGSLGGRLDEIEEDMFGFTNGGTAMIGASLYAANDGASVGATAATAGSSTHQSTRAQSLDPLEWHPSDSGLNSSSSIFNDPYSPWGSFSPSGPPNAVSTIDTAPSSQSSDQFFDFVVDEQLFDIGLSDTEPTASSSSRVIEAESVTPGILLPSEHLPGPVSSSLSHHISKSLPPPTSPTITSLPYLPPTQSLPASPYPTSAEPEHLHTYTCPICFSPPTNATLTPCGHMLCGECLFTAVNSAVMRTGITGLGARCPVCRASIPGWDGRGGGVIGLQPRVMISL